MHARSEVPKMVRQSVWSLDEHAYWINWPFFLLVSRVLLGKMALWIHCRRIDEEQNETPPRVYLIVDLNIKTRGSIFFLQRIWWPFRNIMTGKYILTAIWEIRRCCNIFGKRNYHKRVFFLLELKVWKRRIKYQVFPLFLLLLF